MTDHNFLSRFFFDHPTFICAADGLPILANQTAEKIFANKLDGKKLTENISKYDKFRFEFAMQSKKPQPIIAAATLIPGYSHISFVFGTISGKTSALAILAKNYEEAKRITALADAHDFSRSINDFAELILQNNAVECLSCSDLSLFDPHIITERLVCDGRFSDVRLIYTTSSYTSHTYYSDMGLYAFVCYFTMATAAIKELSLNKDINICILPLEDSFELRLETQISLDAKCDGSGSPKADVLLKLCDFIAGCSQCTFTVYHTENNITLSLISTELDKYTDFKSNDQFNGYTSALKFAIRSTEAICKEADRA